MIQKAFENNAMSEAQMKVWHKYFKMVENILKVTYILEGPQQARHLRMMNVYGLKSTKISDCHCKN